MHQRTLRQVSTLNGRFSYMPEETKKCSKKAIELPRNVVESTVEQNQCCGCGVCAGLCPSGALKMEFNRYGEYNPVALEGHCKESCNLCQQICPFSSQIPDEDYMADRLWGHTPKPMKKDSSLGFFLDCYVGFAGTGDIREKGASGGLATWTLQRLLELGEVDAAICVSPSSGGDKLFEFVICTSSQEIAECSKSCYYPVELSEILRVLCVTEGTYAVVALPCVIKSLRQACILKPELNRKLKYFLGLVCGQQKSKYFAEYICSLGGGDPEKLRQVHFRVKSLDRPASDYGLKFECSDGYENIVYWTEGMSDVWCQRYFTINACNYCDDLFAELADVSFMDAWLPEYTSDFRGTNIVLLRDKKLNELLLSAAEAGEITLKPIEKHSVVQSQQGALQFKREHIQERLYLAKTRHGLDLSKRIPPMKPKNAGSYLRLRLQENLWKKSKEAFLHQKNTGAGLEVFDKRMRPYCSALKAYDTLRRFFRRIVGVVR